MQREKRENKERLVRKQVLIAALTNWIKGNKLTLEKMINGFLKNDIVL